MRDAVAEHQRGEPGVVDLLAQNRVGDDQVPPDGVSRGQLAEQRELAFKTLEPEFRLDALRVCLAGTEYNW